MREVHVHVDKSITLSFSVTTSVPALVLAVAAPELVGGHQMECPSNLTTNFKPKHCQTLM